MSKQKVTVGQDVMVYTPRYGKLSIPRPAKVVRVARVWCRIEATDGKYPSGWNMRLDTQDEGNKSYPQGGARFRTMEQHTQWQEHVNAHAFLREEGVDIRSDSRWNTVAGRVKLANLIRGQVAP